jgi:integrase
MIFKELAQKWLTEMHARAKLDDLKPASLATFISRTNNHILPHLGDLEIETIRNGGVKTFAEKLSAKLGPKSTREVVALVKAILESHVNQDGEPLLDLRWNNKFIFKATRKVGKQHQPTISREALNEILANRGLRVRDRVLIALAAATGMRVGELLALKINGDAKSTTWDSASSTIQVRQSIWNRKLQDPKTEAAIRQIDLSQSVNKMLLNFTAGKQAGEFVFAVKSGKPLDPSYVNKNILKPAGVPGMHSLRRYRASWADENGAPRSLLAAWMGHTSSGEGITSLYIKSAENQKYRRTWCERVGTGLEIAAATLPQRAIHGREIAVAANGAPLEMSAA